MRSALTPISARLEITDVRDVQLSDIVDDGNGGFLRAVKFFGAPDASAGPTLILEVQIRSGTKTDLRITTPTLKF